MKCKWRKVLALGLAAVMTLSVAACGKGGSGDNGNGGGGGLFGGNSGGGKENNPAANSALAKQYVFRATDLDFGKNNSEYFNMNVVATSISGDKVYLLSSEYIYDEATYQSVNSLVLYEAGKDGSGVKSIPLEVPETVGTGEESENSAVMPMMKDIMPVPAEPDVDYGPDDDYGYDNNYSYENNYYNSSVIAGNQVVAIREYNKESYSEEGYESISNSYLDCWDMQGKLLWEKPIDLSVFQTEESWSWVRRMVKLGDGRVALMLEGDQRGLVMVSEDGSLSEIQKSSSDNDYFNREAGSAIREDGTIILSYYNEDWSNQYIVTYDPVKDTYGESVELPDAVKATGFYNFSAGITTDVVYSCNDGLYTYNIGDEAPVKIMDYVNSDLATYGLNNVILIDDEHFFASYDDSVNYETRFSFFTHVKPEDIPDKQVLVLAGMYIDSDVKMNLINFNKNSSQYRITIRDYSNNSADYEANYTKMNNDIIAGNIPDILVLDSSLPVDSYIAKGLFANIDDLIKKDEELSKVEFMDNVFEAYRVNGALYRVIPSFNIRTFIGKKSLLGDRNSITMNELRQIAQNAGCDSIFGMYSRENFMSSIMQFCGSDFVDVNTGKCDFDNDLFVELLEFAKNLRTDDQMYGENYDEDFWNEYYMNYESQYRENRTLLMDCYLYNLSNMKQNINGYFGEEVAYVGFPSQNGTGSVVDASSTYAISAKSANIEGAWEFMRIFLSEDYQRNEDNKFGYHWGLPIHKNLVKEMVEETTKKSYWIDSETGEKNEYDDTFYMNGQEITIQPLSRTQADELLNFVCGISKSGYYSQEVSKIVDEEAASFFAGQKSAKDAAKNIQNRVQLYVNENL